MAAWWIGKPKDGLRYDLEDLELMGDSRFTVGVPESMPMEFKRMVFAAGKAFSVGNTSIDYTLRAYGNHWPISEADAPSRALTGATDAAKQLVIATLDRINEIADKPDLPNLFACTAAMMRLQNTFRAAIITIKSGLHFETAALQRIVIEQLAWITAIRHLPPGQKDFFKVEPPSCIGDLKALIPSAGPLYGQLSNVAHIHPKTTLRYIKFVEQEFRIHFEDLTLSKTDAYHLLHLADMFSIVGEWTFADSLTEHRFIARSDEHWVLNKARPTLDLLAQHQKDLGLD